MISIIICGRNDNYGGNFDERLFSTLDHNLAALRRRQVTFELIFVEWNPIEDRPLLSEEIVAHYPEARCFVVDGLVHQYVSENRYIQVYEYHAKNVAARRARGSWLLLTNPDNYLGDDILDFLQTGLFDPLSFYRADRVQIDQFEEVGQPGFIDPPPDAKPPFGGAPGDFFFCAKEVFERLGGFREDLAFSNTHMDNILNLHMFDHLKSAHKIGVTYHLKHERDQHSARRLDFDFGKVNAAPQPGYGQVEAVEITLGSPQITQLRLPAALEAEARNKAPVEPEIPEYLRQEPKPGPLKHFLTRLLTGGRA